MRNIDPDLPENQRAHDDNDRYIGCLKLQALHEARTSPQMNAQQYIAYQTAVSNFLTRNNVKRGCCGPKPGREPFFSWRSCDCCGSALGGNREHVLFATQLNGLFNANVCSNCVYYLAYDRLDDTTMLEIETSNK